MKFSTIDDELVVVSDSDEIISKGKIDGCPVSAVLAVPDSDDCIVLLDYSARPSQYFENLLRLTPSRDVVWRAKYPADEHDFYVRVRWTGGDLVANTWNGYKVLLNSDTGKITSSSFVK